MNLTAEFALIAPIVVPLLVLLPLYLARNKPDLRESISLTGGFLNFFFVLYLFGAFGRGQQLQWDILTLMPGVPLGLRVDALGCIMLLTAGFLWPIATLYSAGYLRGHKGPRAPRAAPPAASR